MTVSDEIAPPAAEPPTTVDRRADPGDGFVDPVTRMSAWCTARVDDVRHDPMRALQALVTFVVVVGCSAFVVAAVHPDLVLRNMTPTGGDMGAHVWGPDYLLHHLLPNLRLSGWTPDWYDGFPAYQFYMVVPSLLIVALHVGISGLLAIPAAMVAAGVAASGWCTSRLYRWRRILLAVGLVGLVLVIPIPYNIAFKVVAVSGLISLPIAAYAFGRLSDLPYPIPPLCSVAALLFLFNREPQFNSYGNIIGGNMASTMAGEFAFSISLTFALLYLGVAVRGLRTGRYRALAACLFAVAGLCHLIPAFFVLACTALLFIVHPGKARLRWLATMVPVAGLLTAFWVLPFFWWRDYVNDMGWEKLPVPGSGKDIWYYLVPSNLRVFLVLAVLGVAISLLMRFTVGLVLGGVWVLIGIGFVVLPEARLWNARLLPFLYLSIFLLSAIAVGMAIRAIAMLVADDVARPTRAVSMVGLVMAGFAVVVMVGLPMASRNADGSQGGVLPFVTRGEDGVARFLGLETTDSNAVSGWAQWNFTGLEGKDPTEKSGGWPEYRAVVDTMAALGKDSQHGCGRAMWEYDKDRVEGYGTPMALMLMPYFTDGCIGSQEGLYFESSTTVPYHFLMQAELSAQGSTPQRDLPYPPFDMANGVEHLQMMGVKYYLAASDAAVQAAEANPDLTRVATSGPWHVYQVADSPLVEGLEYEPVVWSNVGEGQHEWLDPAVAWFLDPVRRDVPIAADGPDAWRRVGFDRVDPELARLVGYTRSQTQRSAVVEQLPDVTRKALPKVEVTDIDQGDDEISFDVDRTGVPVVVRASYFPNWSASGAEGPWRITPNLMVVVPTSEHVTLTYDRAPIDYLAYGMTALGVVGVGLLAWLPPVAMPASSPTWLERRLARRRGRHAVAGAGPEGDGDGSTPGGGGPVLPHDAGAHHWSWSGGHVDPDEPAPADPAGAPAPGSASGPSGSVSVHHWTTDPPGPAPRLGDDEPRTPGDEGDHSS